MAVIKSRINLRNDSTANWLANSSVVLLKGEVGIEFLESGRTKIKIGNGVTPWIDLPYFNGGGDISAINSDVFIVDGNGNLTMLGFEEAEIGSSPIKSDNGKIIWVKNEVKALETKVESLTEIVNNKVDLVFSEVNGE